MLQQQPEVLVDKQVKSGHLFHLFSKPWIARVLAKLFDNRNLKLIPAYKTQIKETQFLSYMSRENKNTNPNRHLHKTFIHLK